VADSGFSVNTDAMRPAVDGLKSLGDRLQQITRHLESTLDGLGTPWGDDKNGHSFFKQYGPARDQSLTGAASMADAVHGVADGISSMIDNYEKIDEHNKAMAAKLAAKNGGGGAGNGGGGGNGPAVPFKAAERHALIAQTPAAPATEPERARLDAVSPGTPPAPAKRRLARLESSIPASPVEDAESLAAEPTLRRVEGVPLGTPQHGVRLREADAAPHEVAMPRREAKFAEAQPAPVVATLPRDAEMPVETPRHHVKHLEAQPVPAEEAPRQAAKLVEAQPVAGEALSRHEAKFADAQPALVEATPRHAVKLVEAQSAPDEPTLPRHAELLADTSVKPLEREGMLLPTVEGEPVHRGFAELEPESFTPLEPEIPAVPEN
jgi:hypothetical protein